MSKVPQVPHDLASLEASEQVGVHAPARARASLTGAAFSGASGSSGDGAELSYEWLFDAATEAVLVVEEITGTVLEANLAAARLLRAERAAVVGKSLLSLFHASSAAMLKDTLARARGGAAAQARALATPDQRSELSLTMSVFRAATIDAYLLVRLAGSDIAAREGNPDSAVFEAIEGAVSGFLVADSDFRVQYANPAFARMVDIAAAEQIEGESITRWPELTEEDHHRLRAQMTHNEAVTELRTRLKTERQQAREVEVRAVAVPSETVPCWGFTVREIRAHAVLN